jgi:hypothetical protein
MDLPKGATLGRDNLSIGILNDVMYRVYVCQAIETGLRDAAEGRLVDVAEVRRQFGLLE